MEHKQKQSEETGSSSFIKEYILLALGAGLGILALGTWFLFFYFIEGQKLVVDSKAWANFAVYFSGIIGPLLTLISIIYVVRSLNFNARSHNQSMNRLKVDERQRLTLELTKLFDKAMSRSTATAGEVTNLPQLLKSDSVRGYLYWFTSSYSDLKQDDKDLHIQVLGNITSTAEHALIAIFEVMLSSTSKDELNNLNALVWASTDINDLNELLDFQMKSWGTSEKKVFRQPICELLVEINKWIKFLPNMSDKYLKGIKQFVSSS